MKHVQLNFLPEFCSLVVGVPAADIHHITRRKVDARLKVVSVYIFNYFFKILDYNRKISILVRISYRIIMLQSYPYNKRDSQHLNGRGVVQDLIDHNTLKVAVNLRY